MLSASYVVLLWESNLLHFCFLLSVCIFRYPITATCEKPIRFDLSGLVESIHERLLIL